MQQPQQQSGRAAGGERATREQRQEISDKRAAAKDPPPQKKKKKTFKNSKTLKNSRYRIGVGKPLLVAREFARQARAAPPGAPGNDARVALAKIEAVGQRDDDRRS